MTRSMRIMFLVLIAAMVAAFAVAHVKNDALESQASAPKAVTP